MKLNAIVIFAYALFILLGGLMGFLKQNSLASLIMASSFAILLFTSAFGVLYDKAWGSYGGIALTAILLLFFAYRFIQKQQFMPPGLIALVSLIVLLVLLLSNRK